MNGKQAYRAAGVDIDQGNAAARRYAALAKSTYRPGVLGGIGGFAGGFELDLTKYPRPVLVSGTDGVGTKIKVAMATGRHDTIGIDCVAMSVNDILTCGAEPLFFLDYLAVHALDVDVAAAIVGGVAKGCAEAGCALIGGETAEMSDLYAAGEYDLAGTAVGVVNRDQLVDGSRVVPGDRVIGLASNGLHSNGYSLVRKLISERGLAWTDVVPEWGCTVADELLKPTRIYVKPVRALLDSGIGIKAMAHITGGGLPENLPRSLPQGAAARIVSHAWPTQPVFDWLLAESGLAFADAATIWNMGIGYVLVVAADEADKAIGMLRDLGQDAWVIGDIVPGAPSVLWEE
jgi:phosphoribosylformylglycinamidine cyclo-ligase